MQTNVRNICLCFCRFMRVIRVTIVILQEDCLEELSCKKLLLMRERHNMEGQDMERRTRAYRIKTQENRREGRPANAVCRTAVPDMKRLIFLIFISAVLLFCGVGFFSGILPSGASVVEANQQLGDIQYKIIEIQTGDSLWSIAEENMNPGFDDIYDYIHEVKRCNQLCTDEITAGNYLMIPYYE